ncbi:MAG: YegS/Rv2252/BmrU family lipid kinase [Erysipelotrichaceae bacterium]|jgi:diacylglycerol kinase (ATP)|nr:YegS/Rv2252/BmrU family lipid kinase [Erysipelotrichaceae bacterium]
MMQHIFILNPTAGSGKAKSLKKDIENYCNQNNINYKLIITTHVNHASEIAKKYSIKDNVCLYSIGGDGTAYEILNGINDKVPLSVIPAGTGNDFFKMISNNNEDILKILIDSINGRNVNVDYGVANNKRFLNSTTLGLDAKVNHIACSILKNKIIPKNLIYKVASVMGILRPKAFKLKIELDDKIIEQESMLVAVMNGKYYGNGVNPIEDVSIQDGCFDIIVVDKIPLLKLPILLPKYLKGDTKDIEEMKIYKSKKVSIYTDELIYAQSDGENFKSKHIVFDIMENALTLRVPNYSKLNGSTN